MWSLLLTVPPRMVAPRGQLQWTVVTHFGTPMFGEDNTPFMAELTAIVCVIMCLSQVAHTLLFDEQILPIVILAVDCKSAIQLLGRARPPTHYFRCWQFFQLGLERLRSFGFFLHFEWTPSHHKHLEWRPEHGSADHLRSLNHKAHTAASLKLASEAASIADWLQAVQRAHDWSKHTLSWAQHVATKWDEHVAESAPTFD